MKKNVKKIIEWIVFAILTCITLYIVNYIQLPKYYYGRSNWPTTSTIQQFYKMDKNSIDVIFLGSSVAVSAFSPQELYDSYGITSYNLGSEQQSIFYSYWWLNEALRFQSPKVVVLDLRFLPTIHDRAALNTMESIGRKVIDPMEWSSIKVQAIKDIHNKDINQKIISFYLTNIRFHSKWKSGSESDFRFDSISSAELKGGTLITYDGPEDFETFVPNDSSAISEINELQKEYLFKIGDMCKENGIELLLVNLPGNKIDDGFYNVYTNIAAELEAEYIELNKDDIYKSIGAELPHVSVVEHENIWGSVLMTNYIGNILKNDYGLDSHLDPQYEATRDFWNEIKESLDLPTISNFDEYLSKIDNEQYTIIIAIKDEGFNGLSDSEYELLTKMGLSKVTEGEFRESYIGIIDHFDKPIELLSDNEINLECAIINRTVPCSVSSAGFLAGNSCSIVIDGEELAINKRGMNIVVYDNLFRRVIDSVCFDTHDTFEVYRE